MHRSTIGLKDEQQKSSRVEWYAVTIQKEDGHDINGYLMTNEMFLLRIFAHKVKPYKVSYSTHPNKKECRSFLNQLHKSYIALDINDYLFST